MVSALPLSSFLRSLSWTEQPSEEVEGKTMLLEVVSYLAAWVVEIEVVRVWMVESVDWTEL